MAVKPSLWVFGLCVTLLARLAFSATSAQSQGCGTLNLKARATQHCFPDDGSHHYVCCVDIKAADSTASPHGNFNPLYQVITKHSNASSYSWCTCSEEICTQQLKGTVAWNMHGAGWKGLRPRSRASARDEA